MLWLVVFVAVAGTTGIVSCEGRGDEERTAGIIAGSVVGGVVLIIVTIITIVLCALYCYKRVTSLEHVLSSKSRDDSRRAMQDEKSSLMTNEYDTVCTGDELSLSSSVSQSNRGRVRSSHPPREIESEYSEIRRDYISNRNSKSPCSRSATPTDNPLVSGIRGGVVSYGAVSGDTDDRPYSYIQVGKRDVAVSRGGPNSLSLIVMLMVQRVVSLQGPG
ncbi:hypothetical protein GBAR_LOCUS30675 [Geodia barretti]|nr:hypothetical protein GBAR_LOCUS30675 [Geodia barretti]